MSFVIVTDDHKERMAKLAAETVPDGYAQVTEGAARNGDIYFNGYSLCSWRDLEGKLYLVSPWDYGSDVDDFWALARPVAND